MKDLKINHLAAVVAIILHQVISATWYGIFADKWMALNGLTMADAEAAGNMPYVVAIIAAAVTVYTMAFLFPKLNVDSAVKGIQTAALFWLAFLFVQVMTQNMFSLRPFELVFIDEGATFVTFLVTGALLGGWKVTKEAPDNLF